MKKLIGHIIVAAAVATVAAACHKWLLVPGDYDNGGCPIIILPQSEVIARAPIAGGSFPATRTITLSAYHNATSGKPSNFFSGIPFSGDGTTWSGGKYWPANGTLDFLAYSADGLDITPVYDSNVACGVTLAVPDNSSAQTDILYASAAAQSRNATGTPLQFRHAEAALAFTAGANVAYDAAGNRGITVTAITVKNVMFAGTLRLEDDNTCTWSGLSGAKDIGLPGLESGYNVPETAASISDTPFGIGSTGIVVPPQGGTSFTVDYIVHYGRDGEGNPIDSRESADYDCSSGMWTAGKKYVYALSFSISGLTVSTSICDWTLDSQGVPLEKPVSATYLVSNQTTVTFPVATFAPGTVTGIDWGDGDIETKTRTDSSTVTLSHTYASPFSGTVKINVLTGRVDFGVIPDKIYDRFGIGTDGRVNATRLGRQTLSFMDICGNLTTIQNTANCYVVKETGEYMFPCVYGNGIRNSEKNAASYTNAGGAHCADFVNHLGNPVTDPYIENNDGCSIASAGLLFQSGAHLVTSLALDTVDGIRYVLFTVNEIPDTNGYAVLYVKDASDNIMWSWMIWLVADNLTVEAVDNHDKVQYYLLSENIGTIWNDARTACSCPLYQWGRKDPLPLRNDTQNYIPLYDIDGNELPYISYHDGLKTAAQSIMLPGKFFRQRSLSPHNWLEMSWYNNFWNANAKEDDEGPSNNLGSAIKTIYDPCPPGFMVPPGTAFSGFTTSGETADLNMPSKYNVVESWNNGWTFRRTAGDYTGILFPAIGSLDANNGRVSSMNSRGSYWTYASIDENTACKLYFASRHIAPMTGEDRAEGCAIRPCREIN